MSLDRQANIDASVSPRSGITVLEMLVVIAIISLLLGLLLPAVMTAREAARQMQCLSNLRQIGLAVSNYESAHSRLPAASLWQGRGVVINGGVIGFPGTRDYSQNGLTWQQDGFRSGFFHALLPHIEQAAIYERWDYSLPVSSPVNFVVRGVVVPTFICPSDPFSSTKGSFQGGNWARGCYGVNAGPNARCLATPISILGVGSVSFCDIVGVSQNLGINLSPPDALRVNQVWGSGIAGINRAFRMSDVTDGISQTIVVDELRSGINPADRRGVWALPMIGSSITFGHGKWNYGGIAPNVCRDEADQIQDCALVLSQGIQVSKTQCMPCTDFGASYMATPRSVHVSGVQALRLDGSASMIAHEIDLNVWTALHTRSSADVVTVK